MRTSIDHLPSTRRKQVLDITDIILHTIRPEKIILFGSYARGNYVEHRYTGKDRILYEYVSDYDFLVIVPELADKEYILEERVTSQTGYLRQPVNVIVHDSRFIQESLLEGWYFFNEIVKEGILLFDASGTPLLPERSLTPVEQQERNALYFNNWFKRATEFRIDAQNAFDRKNFKHAVFYLHQSTESLYYTMLLVHTSYKPKTHHLYKLRQQTKKLSESLYFLFNIEASAEDKRLFDLLKRGYVDARYNEGYEIGQADLEHLFEKTAIMQTIVAESCRSVLAENDRK